MKRKLLPSERTGKSLYELLGGAAQTDDLLRDLMLSASEHLLQKSLEEEASDFLGRDHYERAQGGRRGYRNGYQDKRLKTSQGTLHVRKPRTRDTEEPFESRILKRLSRIEKKLTRMAIEMYVRGLSTRDIEETLTDEQGKPLLSRSSVSRLTEELYREYEAFQSRDLCSFDVVYLFIDGVYEAVRHYTNNQALLCAWAICSDGTKVLLHLSAASSESEAAWSTFFEEMLARGLRQPLLVVHDGSPALKASISRTFPESDRQRCLAHKLRNLASKLPEHAREEVLLRAKQVYYAADMDTGKLLAERFIEAYTPSYPQMVKCFCDDLDACLAHLKYPPSHRKYIRTTNLLERAFVEEKRRTKVIPQHVNERGAVKLVYAVLVRASRRWQRVRMTPLELAQLRNIRRLMRPQDSDEETISFRLAA
ncbi:MAG TPA: IS256 family transposase [Rhodothermales bacterium]|jgi:transposase-like protein|nr:IS256 family transposase [Rhodothermales bacterium]